MNTGQLLLVVGALALLSTLALSINSTILNAYVVSYDSEATIDAISIGQTMVDEIMKMSFDSITVTSKTITDPSQCTPAARLGVDLDSEKTVPAYETAPFTSDSLFNDVDDYNHYSRIVSTPHLGNFTVTDTVFYVTDGSLNTPSATQTWFKKVIVTVKHPNLYTPVVVKSLVVFRKHFAGF